MGTDEVFFKNYDFGRVFLNIVITFTVSIYLSLFILLIFQDVNWLIFFIIFLIIAFSLTLFPFKKKILFYLALILLLFLILSLLLISLSAPPLFQFLTPTPMPAPMPSPTPTPMPSPTPAPISAPMPTAPPGGFLDIILLLIIIILFILVPILLILRKAKRSEKEIITPLKPDLLRSIFFLIYTSVGWTLFSYLLEMDKEFAGIAAIIAGLIVAGFDPNEIIAITRKNIT
jgi:hypothetical protein